MLSTRTHSFASRNFLTDRQTTSCLSKGRIPEFDGWEDLDLATRNRRSFRSWEKRMEPMSGVEPLTY
jgi:hypothetical protein